MEIPPIFMLIWLPSYAGRGRLVPERDPASLFAFAGFPASGGGKLEAWSYSPEEETQKPAAFFGRRLFCVLLPCLVSPLQHRDLRAQFLFGSADNGLEMGAGKT